MYISLYGTAVKVVSEQDYVAQMAAEREAAEKREREKEQREAEAKQRLDEIRQRRAAGGFAREEKLLSDIEDYDSVAGIWGAWSASGLDLQYPDVTNKIKAARSSERMYGKMPGEANAMKQMIRKSIFGE
jgi:hypothetical protein